MQEEGDEEVFLEHPLGISTDGNSFLKA